METYKLQHEEGKAGFSQRCCKHKLLPQPKRMPPSGHGFSEHVNFANFASTGAYKVEALESP